MERRVISMFGWCRRKFSYEDAIFTARQEIEILSNELQDTNRRYKEMNEKYGELYSMVSCIKRSFEKKENLLFKVIERISKMDTKVKRRKK